ncbi:MAG: (4Fe-4S)-binding protein, partial [bacterium]
MPAAAPDPRLEAPPEDSGHALPHIDMIGNTEQALQDGALQKALGRALPAFRHLRGAAVGEVPEWESLREVAARIKDHALAHLHHHLLRLEGQLTAAGGIVHWASDAAGASRIITDLALTRGVRLAVKSKSMTTEEIHLNRALEAAGVKVVETDLGEYVVQLAGDRPSHLIAPIVHKTAESV